MSWRRAFLLSLALSLLLAATARPGAGQEQPANALTLTAAAGFEGSYKPGMWLPVRVTIANDGPALEGYVRVRESGGYGAEPATYETAVSLGQRSNKRVTIYLFPGSVSGRLTVALVDERGRELATAQTNVLRSLDVDDILYGVVSPNPGGLEFLDAVTGGRGRAAVAFLNVDELPDTAAAWSALDVLVFSNADAGRLAPEQHAALRQWIAAGGVFVLTGGPQWALNAAGLEDLLPVTVEGTLSVDALPALDRYAADVPPADGPYLVTGSSLRQGELLLHQDGRPLLARRAIGRGSVYFLALDPALAPLAGWAGSEDLWAAIAAAAPQLPTWALGATAVQPASEAVSTLPVTELPSPLLITCFLSLYLITVGPVNYLILRRRGRRELGWLTIPALIVLFSGGSYLAGLQLRGREAIVNRMTVAFGSIDGDFLRAQTLVGLYSPRRATYDLLLPAGTLARPFSEGANNMLAQGNVRTSERDGRNVLEGVRADVAETRTLAAESYAPAPELSGSVTLRDPGGGRPFMADITISNNGPGRYEHLTLLLGDTVLGLGALGPAERISVSRALSATAGTTGVPAIGLPRPVLNVAPLAENANVLLGTTDYFTNRELFPRWQLLYAIGGFEVPYHWYPQHVATLAAWGEDSLLEVGLANGRHETRGTTLYLLEIPTEVESAAAGQTTVPANAWIWEFVTSSGTVIDQEPSNLYLPPGFIVFEFRPWPQYQELTVDELALVLEPGTAGGGQVPPRLELWDWGEGAWTEVGGAGWDRTEVGSAARFLDQALRLRLRITNDGPAGVDIARVTPELVGEMQATPEEQ